MIESKDYKDLKRYIKLKESEDAQRFNVDDFADLNELRGKFKTPGTDLPLGEDEVLNMLKAICAEIDHLIEKSDTLIEAVVGKPEKLKPLPLSPEDQAELDKLPPEDDDE